MGTSLGNFIDKEGEGHLGRVVAMWDAFPASRAECLMPPMGHLRTEYSGRSVTTGKDEEDTQHINGLPYPVTGLLIVNATKARFTRIEGIMALRNGAFLLMLAAAHACMIWLVTHIRINLRLGCERDRNRIHGNQWSHNGRDSCRNSGEWSSSSSNSSGSGGGPQG